MGPSNVTLWTQSTWGTPTQIVTEYLGAYLNHFQLLLFFPQYRKDNFLLEKLCLAGKLFVTSCNEWREFLMQNMLSPSIESRLYCKYIKNQLVDRDSLVR